MQVLVADSKDFEALKQQYEQICSIAKDALCQLKEVKEKKYYTAEEAAAYLRIGMTTLEKYEDEIGYSKRGIKRFKKADLDAWVDLQYYKKISA